MKHLVAAASLVLASAACGSGDATDRLAGTEGFTGTVASPVTAWSCKTHASMLSCTAPLPAQKGELGAYACMAGESGSGCPGADSYAAVAGVSALVASAGGKKEFDAMPWACLLTGKEQRQCFRDVAMMGGAAPGGATGHVERSTGSRMPYNTGTAPPPTAGTPPASGTDGASLDPALPKPPASCGTAEWQEFFRELATFTYQKNGIKVDFPASIFDANAPLDPVGIALGETGDVLTSVVGGGLGGVSCVAAEAEMRATAWVQAVAQGCILLAVPILTLCQQAANFAPKVGACKATGTW
jgi:hypothetical protein